MPRTLAATNTARRTTSLRDGMLQLVTLPRRASPPPLVFTLLEGASNEHATGIAVSAGSDVGRRRRQLRHLLRECHWGRALPVRRPGRRARDRPYPAHRAYRPGLARVRA